MRESMTRTVYLNNSGSRWKSLHPKDMEFVLMLPSGTKRLKKAVCFEAFGNFAVVVYRVNGKTYAGLPKAADGSETRVEADDGKTYVFHKMSLPKFKVKNNV